MLRSEAEGKWPASLSGMGQADGQGRSVRAGELYEVTSGSRQAVVTEQGATLFRVRWDGAELLATGADDGYGGVGSHGQLLVPWPGRVRHAAYEFDGQVHHLMVNDQVTGSSIHGLARWLAWQPQEHSRDRLVLACRQLAVPGYPFPLAYEQSYTWLPDCLEVVLVASNIGNRTAPFGYGCHPYFSVGSPTVDDDILRVPAGRYYPERDDHSISGPALPVDGTAFDFRQPKAVGTTHFDVTLTDLQRDEDGRVEVNFRSARSAAGVTCKYDPPIDFIQLYSGDTLPSGQRQGMAIEPYTSAPDAFNNGIGLARLPPGGTFRVRWTLSA